ncbi:protein ALTERED PHOSPHATE STARVATION RESPONSE 1 [Rhododendron vialii]|uniref:protein ALTERED PHOSPHATE STARVATION RESPONSE 1 n=1 Tax=Rhododendron vialii TaxID=182163 RepID=UPI00265E885B|nr:protein ALTERED PHOSPHATE STARVATION RESPONSE 1 [Rhododendron vialii]
MGASSSRIEEDKALQLCRERKKFVREALDGRCSLAATHVSYIQSLRVVGTALRKFAEPEGPLESSLYTSTSATPELLVSTDKSFSQFSFSSPSISQRVDATENLSPFPSPPTSNHYQVNHMKFRTTYSRKVEEKPPVPVMGSVTSSSPSRRSNELHASERPETSPFETSPIQTETSPWDYFGLFHSVDNQISSQEVRGLNQGFENTDNIRKLREEEGIPDLEDEEEKSYSTGEDSMDSEDEFDDPSTDTLVRSFENVNRVPGHEAAAACSPAIPSEKSIESGTQVVNEVKCNSPHLSPLRATSAGVTLRNDVKRSLVKEDGPENKFIAKDFFSSVKEIEHLFIKASESGREVPRMLEANKFHFRPIFPGRDRGSVTSTLIKSCFSCGEDFNQVQKEPDQTSVKYLTWHRTISSRSTSSRNPLGANSRDDTEDLTNNLFQNFCMNSGSHASTLDRLYAWERKLYDEVKASELVRKEYDIKRKHLRQQESKGENSTRIDKTRAVVKDLHSRIGVAIHRIDTISKKIEELRDTELQPQLEELIGGLRRMWDVMFECHKLQFHIISVASDNGTIKISLHSEAQRQITALLEIELSALSSSFTKWIGAQKTYVKALNEWLFKCISLPQQSSKRKKREPREPIRNSGPPIYVTCGVWLEKLDTLPTKEVTESIKKLGAEISRYLPRQEKNQGKGRNPLHLTSWPAGSNGEAAVNLLRDESPEDWVTGSDRFGSTLVEFIAQLKNFAESSVKMFAELENAIQEAKTKYEKPLKW